MTRAVLALVAIALLGACGYHLRGAGEKASSDIAVTVRAARSVELSDALLRALRVSGVRVVDAPTESSLLIDLLDQQQNTRTLSYTERATTAESQLELAVRFQIVGPDRKMLIDDHWARAMRTYLVDTNNLVGSSQQADVMRQELIGDVAQQIVRSLNAATRPR
jgi:LPS-assembly lipoprotein